MLDGKRTCRGLSVCNFRTRKNPKHKKQEEIFTIIKIKLLKVNGKEKILKVARNIDCTKKRR